MTRLSVSRPQPRGHASRKVKHALIEETQPHPRPRSLQPRTTSSTLPLPRSIPSEAIPPSNCVSTARSGNALHFSSQWWVNSFVTTAGQKHASKEFAQLATDSFELRNRLQVVSCEQGPARRKEARAAV